MNRLIFAVLCLCSALSLSAYETVPQTIRMPQRGEAPRHPHDVIIGALGRGDAVAGAYTFAQNFLNAVISADRESPIFSGVRPSLIQDIFSTLATVAPQRFRIGSGREEVDGSTSFIVRFIGRETWVTGELYVRFDEESGAWGLDDLILDDPHDPSSDEGRQRYDFSPFERIF